MEQTDSSNKKQAINWSPIRGPTYKNNNYPSSRQTISVKPFSLSTIKSWQRHFININQRLKNFQTLKNIPNDFCVLKAQSTVYKCPGQIIFF